jgi:hypothetical protein
MSRAARAELAEAGAQELAGEGDGEIWMRSSRVWLRNSVLAPASSSTPERAISHSVGPVTAMPMPLMPLGPNERRAPPRAAHALAVLVAAPAVAEADGAVGR